MLLLRLLLFLLLHRALTCCADCCFGLWFVFELAICCCCCCCCCCSGLIAKHLHVTFQTRPVAFVRCSGGAAGEAAAAAVCLAPCSSSSSLRRSWAVSAAAVAAELQRQQQDTVSLKFCLEWFAAASEQQKQQLCGAADAPPPAAAAAAADLQNERKALQAAVLLQLLDAAGLFSESGGSTVFGSALASVPFEFQEAMFICLELLRLGFLSGDPLESLPGRPFPPGVQTALMQPYPSEAAAAAAAAGGAAAAAAAAGGGAAAAAGARDVQRAGLLLQRVASLLPLQLRQQQPWLAAVCMDLLGFNCLVNLIRNAFQELTQTALVSMLLQSPHLAKVLPRPGDAAFGSFLPSFAASGCSLGLVFRFLLHYGGPPGLAAFEGAVAAAFPAAAAPLQDLCAAAALWGHLREAIRGLSLAVDVAELWTEVQQADALLQQQLQHTGLCTHKAYTHRRP
ncbi:hypothetical protein ETH_00005525 [Eimeria tenella]|uniref:Post-transcriptional regulator MKT1 C-terminal domain-containing protein n=1 Tax=Eimeria tenella TaxID=5802 RepID=U6L3J0_EIMTE|nr:hypothetical protein ETH_00005525 [Eimeria tenella]CDJ43773.1 hypothetical protein ETH_00005525 [Eimeria tenella]|eukprot:XP_013234522.1 hypothetical protein ETH_00005525 [Eimeria tenella]